MNIPLNKIKVPPVNFDFIPLTGGMDQITPTLSLKNGFVRNSLNFEVSLQGGYSLTSTYERYDGRTAPSDNTSARIMVSVASFTNTPVVGNTITGDDSGATGVIAIIDGLSIGMCKVVGTFQTELILVGATEIGTIDNLAAWPTTPKKDAQFKNAIADIYRADIAAPTGSGALRGVVILNDVRYVFRNNAGGTAVDIWKSSAAGWVNVPLLKTVSFTAGGAGTPAEEDTLTQGGVTATIKRVALTSGEWADSDAAGQFIIDTVAGGNFAAGAATAGAVGVTISGEESQLTLAPGGRFEFIVENFYGTSSTKRIYGVDGVNTAFEFDGTILVPIYTGATSDKPKHLIKHREFLVLSVDTGSYLSVTGEPYNFTGAEGAQLILSGSAITGYLVMPGDATNSTLIIFNRSEYGILYGKTSTDFNYVKYDITAGAIDYTVQNIGNAVAFDDRGAYKIKPAQDYGNFTVKTLTRLIQPYINSSVGNAVASVINRTKSQYRIFFDDGAALYITIVDGKVLGSMPILFADPAYCTWESKLSTGEDVMYFGGTDGMLYQLDKGSSQDGDAFDYQFTLNFSSAGSPRTKKRYRKAAFEINAPGGSSYAEINVGYILGYDAAKYSQPGNVSYSTYLANSRWDSFTWDSFFWDSKSLENLEVSLGGTAENIAIFIFGKSDYVMPFTMNSIIVHYTPRRVMR